MRPRSKVCLLHVKQNVRLEYCFSRFVFLSLLPCLLLSSTSFIPPSPPPTPPLSLLTQATFSFKQLPFKFLNVHWDYVNHNATKYFRKITFYKLNCLYFCPMYGKQFKICCGLPVYASEICM